MSLFKFIYRRNDTKYIVVDRAFEANCFNGAVLRSLKAYLNCCQLLHTTQVRIFDVYVMFELILFTVCNVCCKQPGQ